MNRPEQAMQIACANHLYALEKVKKNFTFFHVPNGGKRTIVEASIFKKMGVRAGVPDLVIFPKDIEPLFIELKAKGGVLSPHQKDFHAGLDALGYKVETITASNPTEAVIALGRLLQTRGIA